MAEETIADLLRAVLEERRVSERTLAAELDVSSNALNTWVRGIRIPDPQYVWRIAELANVPIDYAMELAGHLPRSTEGGRQPRAREGHLAALAREMSDRELDLLVRVAETLHEWRDVNALDDEGIS